MHVKGFVLRNMKEAGKSFQEKNVTVFMVIALRKRKQNLRNRQ